MQAQARQKQSLLNIASGIGDCSCGLKPRASAQTKRSWRSSWPISLPGWRVTMLKSRSWRCSNWADGSQWTSTCTSGWLWAKRERIPGRKRIT
ncbi:hypothetical protein D9M71_660120 [compost metagenome]